MLLVPVPNNLEMKAGARLSSFALGFRSLICGEVLTASGEIGVHAAVVYPRFFPSIVSFSKLTPLKKAPHFTFTKNRRSAFFSEGDIRNF